MTMFNHLYGRTWHRAHMVNAMPVKIKISIYPMHYKFEHTLTCSSQIPIVVDEKPILKTIVFKRWHINFIDVSLDPFFPHQLFFIFLFGDFIPKMKKNIMKHVINNSDG